MPGGRRPDAGDSECRSEQPAIIGVDILFGGKTAFNEGFVETETGFARSDFLLIAFEEPFPSLRGVTTQGFWYLPYYKAPGGFETRSITDVLEGEDPAAYFVGKIVLIGPCAVGLQDSYITAIDHARQMYGVEYQANVVQAMLEGSYKREIGTAPQLAALFVEYEGLPPCWRAWSRSG